MQGIDRDEVEAAIGEELVRSGMPGRPNGLAHVIADRILALVPPVEGVVLTPEEAQRVLEWYGTSILRAPEDRALSWMLAARLEAR